MLKDFSPEQLVAEIIGRIGDDPTRRGVLETPKRVVKSWKELFSGYSGDVKDLFKVFDEDDCDEMVILRGIEFNSTCEHHMLPFFGSADIGYLPGKRGVVGVSKLARLLDFFSRRLQIQERIGMEITEALMEHLEPRGCGVILRARHFCICGRGVGKQHSEMVTSSMRGKFRKSSKVRNEFLGLLRS